MTKKIKYRMTLLRFLVSTYMALFFTSCNDYEIKDKNPAVSDEGETPLSFYKIFITTTTFTGNLGGPVGAGGAINAARGDVRCMEDASYPGTGTYKALIADSTRSASPTPTNWVLRASTEYRHLDDTTIIGTTNASQVFPDPLSSSFKSTVGAVYSWTGLNANWTNNSNNCLDWISASGAYYGGYAYNNSGTLDSKNWSNGSYYCNNSYHLICVQQS